MQPSATSHVANLYEWLMNRPSWMIHAAKRILAGPLTQNDIAQLTELAVTEARSGREDNRKLLSAAELPGSAVTPDPTVLLAIRDVRNVNRLAPRQELAVESGGMTIIYGANGSGKSGYARILRQVGRVRGQGISILPDIFRRPAAGGDQSATIDYQVGSERRTHKWTPGGPEESDLLNVCIFDSDSSRTLLNEPADAAFVPQVVSLLAVLAQTCVTVRQEVERRGRAVVAARPQLPSFDPMGAVGKLLSGDLVAPDIEDEIRGLAELTPAESARIAEIADELADLAAQDPSTVIATMRTDLQRLRSLRTAAVELDQTIGPAALHSFETELAALSSARAAAIAAGQLLQGMILPGVGHDAWLRLWESARTYSNSTAYSNHRFPHTGEGAVCVLCQQPIDQQTGVRLRTLEQFVHDDTQTVAENLRAALSRTLAGLRRSLDSHTAALGSLPDETRWYTIYASARTASQEAESRFQYVRDLMNGEQDATGPAAWSGARLITDIDAEISKTEQDTLLLQERVSAERRSALQREAADLRERQTLAENLDVAIELVASRREAQVHRRAWTLCGTKAVSIKQAAVSAELITEQLATSFGRELSALGASRLNIEIQKGETVRGKTHYRLGFVGIAANRPMSDILSEGECRAVALARFLTDVDTAGGAAMVLDDPVSSFDHGYRSRAAARLAKAALDRQVIVFTHDLAFVEALHSSAKACGAMVSAMEIESNASGTGVCVAGIQNLGAGLKTRLPRIAASIEAERHLFDSGDLPAWAAKATQIASQLRAAWERGVEEALLNEAVTRFERPVQTTRLRVVTVEDSDWETVNRAMTQLSRWTDAHDEPAAVGDPAPTPDDLVANLDELTAWKKVVEKRRQLTEQRRPR